MSTKDKKKNSKKSSNKSQESEFIEENSSSQLKDKSINQKLDILLEVVKALDAKVQDQDARLQKQQERVSIANVSALPSAHSSPKKVSDQPEKLLSFEELKSNSKIQAEVDRRLQEYHNASRSEFSGKPNTVLKSGRFRTGVENENEHVSNNVLYQHHCSYCIKEAQRKYDHPASKCMRMKNANGNVKSQSSKQKQTEQRV